MKAEMDSNGFNGRIFHRLPFMIFIFFVFFPYLKIIDIGTDTQPYAIIMASICIICFLNYPRKLKLPPEILALAAPFIAAVVFFAISEKDFEAFRSLVNYISLFLIASSSYLCLKFYGISEKTVKMFIWIWLAVGVIQLFYNREFLTFLISSSRTSKGRGVTSLGVEPSSYARMCLSFIFIVYLHFRKNRRFYIALLLMQIFVIAASFTYAFMLILAAGIYGILHANKLRSVCILLTVGVAAYAFLSFSVTEGVFSGRILNLMDGLIHNPTAVFITDTSGNKHTFSIIAPLYAFFSNYAMPHGLAVWSETGSAVLDNFGSYVQASLGGDRIMSYYGQSLFELGIIGLVIPVSINVSLYRIFRNNYRGFISSFVLVNLMLLSAIPVSQPTVSFLIAYMSYWRRYLYPNPDSPERPNLQKVIELETSSNFCNRPKD